MERKFFKQFNKNIEFNEIEYFMTEKCLSCIYIKNNKSKYFNIALPKDDLSKLENILKSKISDLSESVKKETESNNQIFLPSIILYSVILLLVPIFIIPVCSFIVTKQADCHYNKFIESNYTNEAEIEKAYKLYWEAAHHLSYYNYK